MKILSRLGREKGTVLQSPPSSPPAILETLEPRLLLQGSPLRALPDYFDAKFDAAPSFTQLSPMYPGGGQMYCVPTAAALGTVWLEEHGLDLLPDRSQENSIVSGLASKMSTSQTFGTTWPNAVDGWRNYLDDFYNPLDVSVEAVGEFIDGQFPDEADFTWTGERLMEDDTVVVVAGGAYSGGQRLGGHAVLLAGFDVSQQPLLTYAYDPGQPPALTPDTFALTWVPGGGYYTIDMDPSNLPVPVPPGTEIRWEGAIAAEIVHQSNQLEAWVNRGHDYDYPGDPEEFSYELEVGGVGLLSLEVTTPWGELFDADDHLPGGWAGEDFEVGVNGLWFEAYTEAGRRWFEVGWEDLSAGEWASLDVGDTAVIVDFTGGAWTATVDFDGAPQPAQVPEMTYPLHQQADVPLNPTFRWNEWTGPNSADPGVWFLLEESGTDVEVYEEEHAPAGTTSWAPSQFLAANTQYDWAVDFHNYHVVRVDAVDVHICSWTESDILFTTGSSPTYVQVLTPGSKTAKWTFADADGDQVTVALGGKAGSAQIVRAVAPGQPGDIVEIVLDGTDAKSSLSIKTKGKGAETTVGDIAVNGSLKSLTAKTTDLGGSMRVGGYLGKLVMDDVAGSHRIDINDDLLPVNPKMKSSITLDEVSDCILDMHGVPIKSLAVTRWAGPGGEIAAPWLGKLTVKGDKKRFIAGDFQAAVVLDGAGSPKCTLGSAKVAGELSGGHWDVTGEVGKLTAGDVDGWGLAVHSGVKSFKLGRVRDTEIDVDGPIGSFQAIEWDGGLLAADVIKSVKIKGDRKAGVAGDFRNADLRVLGQGVKAGKAALGSLSIAGVAEDLLVEVMGNVGKVAARAFYRTDLLLGCVDLTGDAGDFEDPLTHARREFVLKSISLKGDEDNFGEVWYFEDSLLGAWVIKAVKFGKNPRHISGIVEFHNEPKVSNEPDPGAPMDDLILYVV